MKYFPPIIIVIWVFVCAAMLVYVEPPQKSVSDRSLISCIGKSTDEYYANYYRCIENLMLSEDFRSKPYLDASDHKTIGFGHVIKPDDNFSWDMSFYFAYMLLKKDFDESIKLSENIGFKYKTNKQLAISHCIFALGIGRTKEIVKKGFREYILKYSGYRKNGKIIFNQRILESRQFELKLYNDKS